MSQATARKTKRTPQQIAAAAVQEWFNQITESGGALMNGDLDENGAISRAYDEIETILEDQRIDEQGPIDPGEDLVRLMFGREAGYLIGVQVGLRLRHAGGK